jgi:hypothetical protein
MHGSERGVSGNRHPYRDQCLKRFRADHFKIPYNQPMNAVGMHVHG